jgi:hypothetical protein
MYEKITKIKDLEIGRYIRWEGNGGFLVRIEGKKLIVRKGKYFISCFFNEQEIEQKLTLDECILIKLNELCEEEE